MQTYLFFYFIKISFPVHFLFKWRQNLSACPRIFKHSDIRIAYRINNTIQNHLIHQNRNPDKFSLFGVYKLTCHDCKKAFVGQTGRNFTRYNGHKCAFHNNSHSSKFTHLNEHAHSFRTINATMQVLHYQRKALTSTQQRFYIHVEFASNNHLNDSHTVFPNSIFDTILKAYHP